MITVDLLRKSYFLTNDSKLKLIILISVDVKLKKTKKKLKEPGQFWGKQKKVSGQMKEILTCTKMLGREKYGGKCADNPRQYSTVLE